MSSSLPPSSPRSSLRRLLAPHAPEDGEVPLTEAAALLTPADAGNKLRHQKLYLVLDLDETLVYSSRLAPDAEPQGTVIHVRGQPFDMVPRPGLRHFQQMASSNYVTFLYTMGDTEYTHAVLRVIDPENTFFRGACVALPRAGRGTSPGRHAVTQSLTAHAECPARLLAGGICCWRQSESRHHKSLVRVRCERRMTLIVDDSIDVWGDDLPNLCLTRRFVGSKLDDGLQLLSWQLTQAHGAFFEGAPANGFSYEEPAMGGIPRAPPSVHAVLAEQRGHLLAGCVIALTGVVADLSEGSVERQALCRSSTNL